ncbi:MAG: RES domain-containing protein [Proteobacteria bacterium]|nr:RES domain-containing protein [Pseudomonadota bacterium]
MVKRRGGKQLRYNVYRGPGFPEVSPGELLLEYFTDHQLAHWRARAGDLQEYHYLWFYELERQRAARQDNLRNALQSVRGMQVSLEGWGRAIDYKYSERPLSCLGSLSWVGGRFNYGIDIDSSRYTPFPALYLAEDLETALREKNGLLRESGRAGLTADELALCSKASVTWLAVRGNINNVFDLTNPRNVKPFVDVLASFRLSNNVRSEEAKLSLVPLRLVNSVDIFMETVLAENWRQYPAMWSTPANSQLLGSMLSYAGFEGVLFSSTITEKRSLAVFPRQLHHSESVVQVVAPPPNARCCILNAATHADAERTNWDTET